MRRRDFILTSLASCAGISATAAARGRVGWQQKKKAGAVTATTVSSNYEITNVVEAHHTRERVAAADFAHAAWNEARPVQLARYWSGEDAPASRRAEARILWDDEGLVARFKCQQSEPLIVAPSPQLARKTIGLWDRDVCEMFIAPNTKDITRYFEFEVAPTGEWIDLAIHVTPQGRETDWNYRSGMTSSAMEMATLSPTPMTAHSTNEATLMLAMRVPWKALKHTPRAGERWRANLFRCIGAGETRGYLAWQPTHTPEASFHVPEKFGYIKFK